MMMWRKPSPHSPKLLGTLTLIPRQTEEGQLYEVTGGIDLEAVGCVLPGARPHNRAALRVGTPHEPPLVRTTSSRRTQLDI